MIVYVSQSFKSEIKAKNCMSHLVFFFDTRTLYTSLILAPCILLKNSSSTERCALMLPPHPDVGVLLPLDQLILVHRILECFAHMYKRNTLQRIV